MVRVFDVTASIWHPAALILQLFDGGKHFIVNVPGCLNRTSIESINVSVIHGYDRRNVSLLLFDPQVFLQLCELQLKVCLGEADLFHLQVKLLVLASEVLDVVFHLFVFEAGDSTGIALDALSEPLKLSLKLNSVLSEISDQSLQFLDL